MLLTCKQHGVSSETWQKISELLPQRSEQEISGRYHILMEKLRSWLKSTTPEHDNSSEGSDDEETSDSDSEEEN